jgi:two-component system sensor histidine kinase KdpD
MTRASSVIGVFVVAVRRDSTLATPELRELITAFAAQLALMVEREQLRIASEREKLLAESDRLNRTLLDSVSHELKTPLAVLRSALENIDRADLRRREELLAEIWRATGRLDRLVANLLDQTRLESGAVRAQLDWCDARDLINAARRAIGEALAGRVVKIDVPPTMPLFNADARLMEHVLSNLLLNAAVHTPPGTAVTLSAGISDEGDRVVLTVADAGPGIAPELREHLFEKFHRGPGARPGGLGLGLSIVRGFMLAQGGSVTVEDAPTGGAVFKLQLPLAAHDQVPNE